MEALNEERNINFNQYSFDEIFSNNSQYYSIEEFNALEYNENLYTTFLQ